MQEEPEVEIPEIPNGDPIRYGLRQVLPTPGRWWQRREPDLRNRLPNWIPRYAEHWSRPSHNVIGMQVFQRQLYFVGSLYPCPSELIILL